MNFKEQEVMIFSNEYGYSLSISKKDVDGNWERIYLPVNFKKGVSVENKTKILIKDSWLSYYIRKTDEKNILYIFVNEFEVID